MVGPYRGRRIATVVRLTKWRITYRALFHDRERQNDVDLSYRLRRRDTSSVTKIYVSQNDLLVPFEILLLAATFTLDPTGHH